ncbi:MAG: DegT/DnrJ/EryC1/StrS family aminotransferase [Alphaproteobacteria bacterium]|nr:DegT/DnrJ/EryC1/StrS family aminotransferase [Alphaproteobacteria bacterium]
MRIPFYDHARIYRRRKAEIDAAIARVLDSGRLDWGDEVPSFEAEFAAFLGASHAVTVNSGTAALKIALLGLGIGPGDEVITITNSDIGTVSAIHHVGASSVWVDVEPVSLCMNVEAARAAITPRTKAILPVDLFGHPAALIELRALADAKGLALVEDACLALGASLGGRKVGTIAHVTCFSFAPTKHLGSIGSGGACVTADASLAERMRKLAAYGQDRSRHRSIGATPPPLHHETEGLNERMDEIQAAVLRVKLADVPESVAVRRRQAAAYAQALGTIAETPSELRGAHHAFRNYVIHVEARDRVREEMTARGIATAVSYAPPMHLQPVYAWKGSKRGAFPVSEGSGDRLLGLPIGPHLDDAQIAAVADAVRASIAATSR